MLVIMSTKKIGLGWFQFDVLSALERSGKRKFTVAEVKGLFPSASKSMVLKTLSKLCAKGRIHRLKRGFYLLVPLKEKDFALNELSLAGEYFPEGYVSFLAAMRYYGWTDQLPSTITVVQRKYGRKKEFQGTKYFPFRASEKFFFGFDIVEIAGVKVKLVLKEKMLLDCMAHPELCNGIGEIARALKRHYEELDWKRVGRFAGKMGNSAVERRLRYLLWALGLKAITLFEGKNFGGYRLLDPSLPKKGRFNSKYGLIVNADVLEEMR
ncbi:TPA: hypothetical protein HA244_03300 [Candidatus Micrarchaeota archaeon]|nr:hypothetical protein [Candidatus Micrarchaeota archaeon]